MTDWFADIEDDLTFGQGAQGPAPSKHMFTTTCIRCGGSGRFRSYAGRDCGPCHTCKGVGSKSFAQPYEVRAKARSQAADRKVRKAEAWAAENPEAHAWIVAKAPTFAFAASMQEAVTKYGALTENQLAAVHKLRIKDEERTAERAAQRAQVEASAPRVDTQPIEAAFAHAAERKRGKVGGDAGRATFKDAKLRLGEFVISPAPAHGKNAGALYVKRTSDREYLGKVQGGKFVKAFQCDAVTAQAVVEACADPQGAAIAYGRLTSSRACCGRTLDNEESIARGIGPICAENMGW